MVMQIANYFVTQLFRCNQQFGNTHGLCTHFDIFKKNIYYVFLTQFYLMGKYANKNILFKCQVCLSVCLCPANILIFYLSAIRRDIDL